MFGIKCPLWEKVIKIQLGTKYVYVLCNYSKNSFPKSIFQIENIKYTKNHKNKIKK